MCYYITFLFQNILTKKSDETCPFSHLSPCPSKCLRMSLMVSVVRVFYVFVSLLPCNWQWLTQPHKCADINVKIYVARFMLREEIEQSQCYAVLKLRQMMNY